MSIQGEKVPFDNVTPFSALAPQPTISQRQVLMANQKLQRHLQLERLVAQFFDLCNKVTVVDGINLTADPTAGSFLNQSCGELTQHKVKYNLSINSQPLGTLCFHRRKRFREQELANLEALQGALVYPLNNAFMYERLLRESLLDPLTGIGNRRAFDQQLVRECEIAKRYSTPLSLVIYDIDHFKQINDRHGHLMGDQALKECAKRLHSVLRRSDSCYRLGGEEFAVLLHNTQLDQAQIFAERSLAAIRAKPLVAPKARIKLTCSAGIAEFEESPERLFEYADQGLYKAKSAGRDCVALG